jgi:hypothetical protein
MALVWGCSEFTETFDCQVPLVMDDAIHKAIADLSALIKDADSEDAERIREIVERLQNFDAQMLMLA